MRFAPPSWSVALGALILAGPLAAQEVPVVTGAEIDAALSARSTATEAERAAVRGALDRAEVAAVAGRMGVDLDAARGAVAGLEGEPLTRAAALAGEIEHALAGGQTFSINATTLIIILLLVILVVLIAD